MKKIIAILTKKGFLSKEPQANNDLNIFRIEEEKVIGYEKLKLENEEYHTFSSLLKSKRINLLYIDTIASDLKKMLEAIGITTRCKDECDDDKFLNTFIFA